MQSTQISHFQVPAKDRNALQKSEQKIDVLQESQSKR
jgi:hypothetical protein